MVFDQSTYKAVHRNILLEPVPLYVVDEAPEEGGKICGRCAHYVPAKCTCWKTGKEVGYLWQKKCFTKKRSKMEETKTTTPAAAPGTRVCKQCGRELPASEFIRKRNGEPGDICRACWAEKARTARNKALGNTQKDKAYAKPCSTDALKAASDNALAQELRARGYEVRATKTTVVEL